MKTPTKTQNYKIEIGYLKGVSIVATFHADASIEDIHEYLESIEQSEYLRDCGEYYIEQCGDCGSYELQMNTQYVESESDIICEYCIGDHYSFCDGHQEYYNNNNTSFYHIRDNDTYASEHAFDSGEYFYCESCDNNFTVDSYGGDGECDNCHDSGSDSRHIHSYSYKPTPEFFGIGRYFGVELEVEHRNSVGDVADEIIENSPRELLKKFYMKEDGSLSDGIEYVTHPLSLHEHTKFWPALIEQIKSADSGSRSHDVSSCGLHVHVGRKEIGEATISRIAIFLMVCSNNLQIFARRRNNTYCEFTRDVKIKDARKETNKKGRYCALNLSSDSTIEFRFFKGTLKVETILASIELVEHIVSFCKNKHSLNTVCSEKNFWERFLKFTDKKRSGHLNEYLISKKLLKEQLELIEAV